MFARFDENPAMTLRVIKETKRYGRTDGHTDGRTDNVKTVYPLQTKFAGGIITWADPEGCRGSGLPTGKSQRAIGFLRNNDTDTTGEIIGPLLEGGSYSLL